MMWRRYLLFYFSSALALFTFSPLMIGQASASTIPQLSDCSDRIRIPVNWASTFKAAVFAKDGSIVNDKWQIFVGMDSLNPKQLFVTAAAGQNQIYHSIKITNNVSSSNLGTLLDFKSTDQTLYRMYWTFDNNSAGTQGSVQSWQPADNYTRSLTVYCGFGNVHVEYITPNSHNSVTSIAPIKQDIDLGFIDPPAAETSGESGGGSGSSDGITDAQLQATLTKFFGIAVAVFVGYKIISIFKVRRTF